MRNIVALIALVVATTVFAGGSQATYFCSLTKKTIPACCCTQLKNGKLYCNLAKKTISSCCCKPTKAK
jgi:hypothetical protein